MDGLYAAQELDAWRHMYDFLLKHSTFVAAPLESRAFLLAPRGNSEMGLANFRKRDSLCGPSISAREQR